MNAGVAAHEAGHAIAAAALGIGSTVEIHEDGGGQCRYDRYAEAAEDRVMLALAGEVAEAVLFNGGNLRRAVTDCLASGASDYSDNRGLHEALKEVPRWRHRDVVLQQAARARKVLHENRAEFDALRQRLALEGRATYAPRSYVGAAPYLTAPELRAEAKRARSAGYITKAILMERTADRAQGLPVVELREDRIVENGRVVAGTVARP
jgi:hypothetical protein